jgi:cytolysin-activating lysine-acyltransferase
MSFWSKKRDISDASVPDVLPASQGKKASTQIERKPAASGGQSQQTSTATPPRRLSAEEMQQTAADAKKRLALFGEIVAIFMRSPQFRTMSVAELEALIVPAVNNNQFFVVESQSKENGVLTPVGAALWATVSAEVDRRLSSNLDQPVKLSPAEWKSGDIGWLVASAGDDRVLSPVLKQICEKALKGAPVKLRTKDKDGQLSVTTFSPAA